ncbi:MAG: 3-oxoacyl-[acyl-carrier protein] reductase [Candidatus Binatota bacterium]|nr:3-oxoacyl-[acyl-carrier protein] reductase [Candidatus Binatota bacterium]
MNRLKGRIALVTGAGSGLGAAISRRFAEEGAVVVVNDLHLDTAERVHAECEKTTPGGAAVAADVADSAAVRRMFEDFDRKYGRLDVLVNNAGIGLVGARSAAYTRLWRQQMNELQSSGAIQSHCDTTIELSDEDWDRMLRIHLYGTFYCSREALKIMRRQTGTPSAGKIVNMGSIMGTAAGAGAIDYCAAKAGILGFTRALARELVTRNIQVNAIAPGFIETPLIDPLKEVHDLIRLSTPQGRLGQPDDVAWAAVYLASPESDFVTGQVLSPNGGWHMSQ